MGAERLPSLHSGVKSTVMPGDVMSREMGQYGKGHDFAAAAAAGLPTATPGQPPALVRGGAGGIKAEPKFGSMGPGKYDAYGSQGGYGAAGDNS